jgi:hypothetical protein
MKFHIAARWMSIVLAVCALLMAVAVLSTVMGAPEAASQEADEGASGWAQSSGGATEPSTTWYFPEGATAGGYETWILVYNPGCKPADLTFTFHSEGEAAGPVDLVVEPETRASVNVGDHVYTYNVATVVRSDRPVVASRSMYDSDGLWAHSSEGTNRTSRTWYFSEGASVGASFETWILLHNPSKEPAKAEVSFHVGCDTADPFLVELPATSRVSINMGDRVTGYDVATKVESDRPIAAARTMYGQSRQREPVERVLDVAREQLGKPYSRGAAGPDSFDCSGLTRYCYLVGAGLSIPHGSYSQRSCGNPVDKKDLLPGDIVAFHGWGHVGIYIGAGKYIHSPQTGEVVSISDLSERKDYSGAVRPL